MNFSSELIDEVVRNVMRELNVPQASVTAAPNATLLSTTRAVELKHRVITEDVLASESAVGGTIVIPAGAVITPSGRDYIRRHGIAISSKPNANAGNTAAGMVLVVRDTKSLSAAAASAGWTVTAAAGNFDAANQVAQGCRDQPAVCCSTQPSIIACLVNRNTQRRAAVVTSRTCLSELLNDMNPDTVCLSAANWSFAELLRMLKQLTDRNPAVPADWRELA